MYDNLRRDIQSLMIKVDSEKHLKINIEIEC